MQTNVVSHNYDHVYNEEYKMKWLMQLNNFKQD